jgi:hypothetical protein
MLGFSTHQVDSLVEPNVITISVETKIVLFRVENMDCLTFFENFYEAQTNFMVSRFLKIKFSQNLCPVDSIHLFLFD